MEVRGLRERLRQKLYIAWLRNDNELDMANLDETNCRKFTFNLPTSLMARADLIARAKDIHLQEAVILALRNLIAQEIKNLPPYPEIKTGRNDDRMTTAEAALYANCSGSTLIRLARENPGFQIMNRFGSQYEFSKLNLDILLKQLGDEYPTINGKHPLLREATDRPDDIIGHEEAQRNLGTKAFSVLIKAEEEGKLSPAKDPWGNFIGYRRQDVLKFKDEALKGK